MWHLIYLFVLGFNPPPSLPQASHPAGVSDSLTVYVFLLEDCLITQFYTPALTKICSTYQDQKVGCVGYFPNVISTPERIASFAETYQLDFPLLPDPGKVWAKKLGMTVTPEVAVWDHRAGRMIYRGRIDDSYVRVGKRKTHPQSRDLEDVLQHWVNYATPDDLVTTRAIGCIIGYP